MARDIRVYSVFSEIFFLLATWTLTKLRPRAQPNFRLRETNDPGLVLTVVPLLFSPYIRVTPPPPFPARFPTSALLLFHPYSGDPSPSPYPHTSPYRTPPSQSKLLISYVFEWTLLAPRNFETLIFNNSASAHGILIFRSFNGKRPRPFVHLTPSLPTSAQVLAQSDSHDVYERFPLLPEPRFDIQSLRDILSRFLGHELVKKLNFVGVKFHPVERPLPTIVTCSRLSSTWHTVHNSSSTFAGAKRPRQKTFLSPSVRKVRSPTIARY